MEDERTVLKLIDPVDLAGEEYTELRFRKARGKDLADLPLGAPKFGDLMRLAARLAGVPPSVIEMASAADAARAVEIAGESLGSGQPTGEI